MPTYIPFDQNKSPKVKVRAGGFRAILQIPYIFSFPYFSGTSPTFVLSCNTTNIKCTATLYRLSGIANERAEHLKEISEEFKGGNVKLTFPHLKEPGNYSVKLKLTDNNDAKNKQEYESDIVYFDALPKDGTSFNVLMIFASALIGFIAGLITGQLSS